VFKPNIQVKTVLDGSVKAAKNIRGIEDLAVYVGIPEASPSRKGGDITNAELAFLLTKGVRTIDARRIMGAMMLNRNVSYNAAQELYIKSRGSMAYHTPPTPIIEPAIELDQDKIIPELREAASLQLDGKRAQAVTYMKRAGMAGQNVVRNFFTDPRNNWPPNAAATIRRKGSSRRNIDTGALRQSIIWLLGERAK
jgi:hypothetical protein